MKQASKKRPHRATATRVYRDVQIRIFDIISYSLFFLLTDTLVSRMSAANGQLNYYLALLLGQLQPLRVLSAF